MWCGGHEYFVFRVIFSVPKNDKEQQAYQQVHHQTAVMSTPRNVFAMKVGAIERAIAHFYAKDVRVCSGDC